MKDYFYIQRYNKNYHNPFNGKHEPVDNDILVIGFLRKWFKFKLFLYINL